LKRGMILGCSVAGAVLLIVIILVIWAVGAYNNLVTIKRGGNSDLGSGRKSVPEKS
jgi:hypothetical protein